MEDKKYCPICKQEMEDTQHVGVKCFYDVSEVVPTLEKNLIFLEVEKDAAIWGVTRHYTGGMLDYFTSSDGGKTENGCHITKVNTIKKPMENPDIRLLEKTIYSQTCCKSCRADFMQVFKRWVEGEFVSSPGEGNIPVRINGAIKYLTMEQWNELQRQKEAKE